MSSNNKQTIATRTLLFTKILAAIAQYLTTAIVLGGKSLTPQALSAVFQTALQAEEDLQAARQTVVEKQKARDAAVAQAVALLPPLRQALAGTYGEDSTTFTSFGFAAPRKATKSSAVVAAAAAKSRATRAAHTAAMNASTPASTAVVAPVAIAPAPVTKP